MTPEFKEQTLYVHGYYRSHDSDAICIPISYVPAVMAAVAAYNGEPVADEPEEHAAADAAIEPEEQMAVAGYVAAVIADVAAYNAQLDKLLIEAADEPVVEPVADEPVVEPVSVPTLQVQLHAVAVKYHVQQIEARLAEFVDNLHLVAQKGERCSSCYYTISDSEEFADAVFAAVPIPPQIGIDIMAPELSFSDRGQWRITFIADWSHPE